MTTLHRYTLLLVVALLAAALGGGPKAVKPTSKATAEALQSRG